MIARPQVRFRGGTTYRELAPRPYFSHVERVEAEFLGIGFLGLHDLHFRSPGNWFAPFDGLPKVPFGIVRVLARHADCFAPRELLLAMVGEEVILDIDELSFLVDPVGYSAFTTSTYTEGGGETHTT